jgi:isopenicillin N synthase-like dioxygenase
MKSGHASNPLPLIDVAPVLAGAPRALANTASEVREALEQVGFFSIVGHGIEWTNVERMYEWAAKYHALSDAKKFDHPMSATQMGYIGFGGAQRENRPHALNAAFFMGRPGSARNRFPTKRALPGFREAAEGYYRLMESLCRRLLPLYAVAADMPADYFEKFFSPALATLRVTHYPPISATPDQWGIEPHSDAGFMTLLPTNKIDGLSIEGADGWFGVAQEAESFVVNAGDTLRAWSNHRFLSTRHRALNESDDDRYAVPFFFDPRTDTVIEPISGCVDEDHPPVCEGYRYGDYLRAFMQEGYAQTTKT